MENEIDPRAVVLISADAEWAALSELFPEGPRGTSPFGEWFSAPEESVPAGRFPCQVIFFHGGWGKISAAASTQYALERWQPALLINLGTCGGLEGRAGRGDILLVERTIVYDIVEQMGDTEQGIAHYSTQIDLTWLPDPLPFPVRRTALLSADRDLLAQEVPWLVAHFGGIAGDWESGAIAWVANRNHTPLLILRGVSDVVGAGGGEAYGNKVFFDQEARQIMHRLVEQLPDWLAMAARAGILQDQATAPARSRPGWESHPAQ